MAQSHLAREQARQVMAKLRAKAQEHPAELHRAWFNDTQFQTSSQYLSDYLDEAERNLTRLMATSPQALTYPELAERVEQQLQALAQALYQ